MCAKVDFDGEMATANPVVIYHDKPTVPIASVDDRM